MTKLSPLFSTLCLFCMLSCVDTQTLDEPNPGGPEIPPPSTASVSLKVDFTIEENFESRSASFSEDPIKLDDVWIVVTNVVNSKPTFFKQQLVAGYDSYSATINRAAIEGADCRLYFIGDVDTTSNFLENITTIEQLLDAQCLVANSISGVPHKGLVLATQDGIKPEENNGSITIKGVKLKNAVARLRFEYRNMLEPIHSISISGTSERATLRPFFDFSKQGATTEAPSSFVITDSAPGMGGASGVIGYGYYYVNLNGENPVDVQVDIAGQKRIVTFSDMMAGYSYGVAVRYGVLLGYGVSEGVTYGGGQFAAPPIESTIELTCEQGATITSDVSWLVVEQAKTRAGQILIETKQLRCQANTSSNGRSGKVTIRNTSGAQEVFTIVQSSDNSNVAGIEFVQIPAGSFVMGSPLSELNRDEDETQHVVKLTSGFSMGKYEVTNSQFCLFLNAKKIPVTGISTDNKVLLRNPSEQDLRHLAGLWTPISGKENLPVVNVTWYGASQFAAWAGASLPTEAQWEYACRGKYANKETSTQTAPFGVGSGYDLTRLDAQFFWDFSYTKADGETIITGLAAPKLASEVTRQPLLVNGYGLSDMHGNVWEWCSDWYSPTYGSVKAGDAVTDPIGGKQGITRVMRGGSWYYYARSCRSAFRMSAAEGTSSDNVGFRVVRQ